MHWEDEIEVFGECENNDKNLKDLEEKVKSVNFPLGESYKDETTSILKLTKEDAVCIISDYEEVEREQTSDL